MGCGSFLCDGCRGRNCNQNGGQNGDCKAIIEVPLSDGKTVYLKGHYEDDDRTVEVKLGENIYKFYAEQWKQYFDDWFPYHSASRRKSEFLGGKVYTYSYKDYAGDDGDSDDEYEEKLITRHCECQPYGTKVVDLTKEILAKCIRADRGMNLPDEEQEKANQIQKLKDNIEQYKKEIIRMQTRIPELEEQIKKLTKPNEPKKRKLKVDTK